MLTDEEILNSINAAPLGQGPQSFVLAVGRAIEAAVLAKFQPVGEVNCHISSELDLVIGTQLFIRREVQS